MLFKETEHVDTCRLQGGSGRRNIRPNGIPAAPAERSPRIGSPEASRGHATARSREPEPEENALVAPATNAKSETPLSLSSRNGTQAQDLSSPFLKAPNEFFTLS